jgi:hypothetical protein
MEFSDKLQVLMITGKGVSLSYQRPRIRKRIGRRIFRD